MGVLDLLETAEARLARAMVLLQDGGADELRRAEVEIALARELRELAYLRSGRVDRRGWGS